MIGTHNPWDGALEVWGEAARLIGEARIEASIYLAITIGFWGLIDFQIIGDGFSTLAMIIDFLCAFFLTVGLLTRGGLVPDGLKGSIGIYFVLSLASGIALAVGLVLLIVPGIVLMVRWLPLYGYALAEDAQGMDAFGASWEATRNHFWPLFVAVILPVLAMFAPAIVFVITDFGMILSGSLDQEYSDASSALVFGMTMVSSVGVLVITAIGIASYSLLRDSSADLNAVFE